MPEGQAEGTPKKRKGLLAFYFSTGLLALLFLAFHFAWTPLKVRYYERQVRRAGYFPEPGGLRVAKTPRQERAEELARLGPVSYGAFARLLMKPEYLSETISVMAALEETKSTWALPLLAEFARSHDDKPIFAAMAAYHAGTMVGKQFMPGEWSGTEDQYNLETRRRFLNWWEREGKTKYGRPGE